jgi:hypothetical protein
MKRYLRFSLRFFLFGVTLFAVFGGLELSRQSRQADAVTAIRKMPGCYLAYDYDVASPEWERHLPPIRSTVSGWIRQCTNSDFFSPVVRLWLNFDTSTPSELEAVSALRHLRWLHIAPAGTVSKDGVDGSSLEPLRNCDRLEYLALGSWVIMRPEGTHPYNGTGTTLLPLNVSRDDIQSLTHLPNLRVLVIGGNRVNDDVLGELRQLRQLEYLYLSHDELSGDGFVQLTMDLEDTTIIRMDDRSADYSVEINSRF